jgi:7-carboxy-7-deazaguanine synthase
MKIAEVFASIQGEGTLVGVPSLFIRTSGCNLRCTWCDTPYTSWTPEGDDWSVEDLAGWAAGFPHIRHAVITGGEPMIAPGVIELTERLARARVHITIETAGTVWQPVHCDLMSISPKLANSTPLDREEGRWAAPHDRLRYQPTILRRLMDVYEYQLKFVVATADDLVEIRRIVDDLRAPADKVLLMPEGTNAEVLRRRGQWLVELCKADGFRYSPRLHIDLYGNQRGV